MHRPGGGPSESAGRERCLDHRRPRQTPRQISVSHAPDCHTQLLSSGATPQNQRAMESRARLLIADRCVARDTRRAALTSGVHELSGRGRVSARALAGCGIVARQFEGAEKPAAGLLQARRNSH